ncbi:MAG: TonB-dependent receptor [Gammaproteobacteria bacterium]|nr:MAG: TonB-dependent receptor [Gammaproteobacteria bacterium]
MYRLKQVLFLVCFISFVSSEETYEVVTITSVVPKNSGSIVTSVDVLDLDFLNNALAKDLTSLLKNNLAIDVSNNGGMGQLSSIFLRGSNSNHTLVKINGIKINPSTAGGASVYNLDTQLINTVEIGYGPLSAIHGSNAIGGVIDISTKSQSKSVKTALGLSLGPDEFRKYIFKTNQEISDNIFFNISASNSKTDGFPSLSNSDLDRGYENKTIISNIEFNSEFTNIELSSWSAEGDIEYLVFGSPTSQEYKNSAYGLEISNNFERLFFYEFNLSTSQDLIRQNDLNFLGLIDITNTKREFVEFILSEFQVFGEGDLAFGINKEKENIDYSSYGTIYKKEINTKSIFASSSFESQKNSFFSSVRSSNHDIYNDNLSWNVEGLRNLNSKWKMGLSRGSSFRSPVSSELYGFGGNIFLEPEINSSSEINIKRIRENSRLNISVFKNNVTNLIDFDYQDYVLKNITQATNEGLEIRYKLLGNDWDVNFTFRAQDPKDNQGEQLLRRSKKSASFSLTKNINGFTTSFNFSAFGKRKDFGDIRLPGYGLSNLSTSWVINKKLKFSLKLENVFDKDYFTAATSNAFYLNQGRSVWMRLNYEFEN